MSAATLRATAQRIKLKGDEYLASELEQAAQDLLAVCEERDRYKADSEALDWIIKTFPGFVKTSLTQLDYPVEFRDALRKRLEGK